HIATPADADALNEFLNGKIVRHWGTSFERTADGDGAWNIFLAYEVRVNDVRHGSGEPRPEHRRDNRPMRGERPQYGAAQHGGAGAHGAPARPAREKAPREDYQPQIAAADQPLFEAVRKWRNARAREERVKPFALFNNKQLEDLVNAKPTTADSLR